MNSHSLTNNFQQRSQTQRRLRKLVTEQLEARCMLAADPIITEFMASNDSTINDGFGSDSDWIEIHNRGDEPVDLSGYHLTDTNADLAKWTFPAETNVEPGEYLLVFASSADTVDPLGYHHTNFKLSAGGEYIALTAPDLSVLSEFGANGVDYPPQVTDVSYGLGAGTLLTGDSQIDYLIPADGTLGLNWTHQTFDASANGFQTGAAAIGYENTPASSTSFEPYFQTEVPSGTTSVYVRHAFDIVDASNVTSLNLFLQFDDGFIAYLNGERILDVNAPTNPTWNATATMSASDSSAIQGTTFSLADHIGLLQDGSNTIAFHALNRPNSSDFLFAPTLLSDGSELETGFLATPTPGATNGALVESGPVISSVVAGPESPVDGQPILITAEVLPIAQAVNRSSVMLTYRQMFEQELTLLMLDDGNGVDAQAGDGIYSAVIPGSAVVSGEMVRWFVTAEDTSGLESRSPRFVEPTNSAEYFGTVVVDPTESDDLPVIHWFVEDTAAAQTRAGTRASFQMLGQFYDNITVDLHGQSTAGSDFIKKSFDFDANTGDKFRYAEGIGRVSDFNLLTNYADQTKLRQSLAYDTIRESGVPTLNAFPVSVHRNGEFYGLYDFVEEGDEEFLERLGLNTNHSLYKVNNALTSAFTNVSQLAGTDTSRSDLEEVVTARSLSQTEGRIWDFDHLDMADMANYLAVNTLIFNQDFGHKNMYWYRDNTGTGLWSVWAWDVDLSFGHNWGGDTPPYFDDTLYTQGGIGNGLNPIFTRMHTDSRFSEMYERRIRTLMDEFMGEPGTSTDDSFLGQEIERRRALISDEALADFNEWGLGPNFTHTPEQAAQQLLDEFLPARRNWLEAVNSRIPNPQSDNLDVRIGSVEYQPTSGNANEQYVLISNGENVAVDISGWTMTGAVTHTFKPGTVIPPNDQLFLVADVPSFLERSTGPRGGQKRFIQASQTGQLDTIGGRLTLSNSAGSPEDELIYGTIGDFDRDGDYGCSDINILTSIIASGTYSPIYDLNGDGELNLLDRDAWLSQAGEFELGVGIDYQLGDANLDGVTDISDFNIWNASKFTNNSAWCSGDFNADGAVDISDFNVWNANKFTAAAAPRYSEPEFDSLTYSYSSVINSDSHDEPIVAFDARQLAAASTQSSHQAFDLNQRQRRRTDDVMRTVEMKELFTSLEEWLQ